MREHSIGVSVSATKPEISTRDRHRDAELVEQSADAAGEERHRHEHRDQRDGGGEDREADLLRAVERRAHAALAHLHVAVDVLEHDDGVVDDQSDRQHQRQQRQDVEAEAERST